MVDIGADLQRAYDMGFKDGAESERPRAFGDGYEGGRGMKSSEVVITICLIICLVCNLVILASQIYLAYWEHKLDQARRDLQRHIRTGGTSR